MTYKDIYFTSVGYSLSLNQKKVSKTGICLLFVNLLIFYKDYCSTTNNYFVSEMKRIKLNLF
uniref:Uncharacterized protein n=1 Tax=Agarophyton chilense TaxID=2510777 RepID=O50050_AGACH|nr:ORF17 [Agarophyton chilense]AAC04756.1 ORF5 [Agarophyton chilense]